MDAALLRPGRIDRKVEYKLATSEQAAALFDRFYPVQHILPKSLVGSEKEGEEATVGVLEKLKKEFVACVPEHEFSTADLQGYLLSCKVLPEKAAKGIAAWVADERRQKEEKQMRKDARRRKMRERMETQSTFGGVSNREKPLPPTVSRLVNGSTTSAGL